MTITTTATLVTYPLTATIAMHNIAHGGMRYSFSVANGGLTAEQLDGLFRDLLYVEDGQTVNITDNPGEFDCNHLIAINKGWTVIYNVTPSPPPGGDPPVPPVPPL